MFRPFARFLFGTRLNQRTFRLFSRLVTAPAGRQSNRLVGSVGRGTRLLLGTGTIALFGLTADEVQPEKFTIEQLKVPAHELKELTALFKSMSPNGNPLDRNTFIRQYKEVTGANDEIAEILFELLDVTHDGKISMNEFITGTHILHGTNVQERLQLFFYSWDSNSDGLLSTSELENAFERYHTHQLGNKILEYYPELTHDHEKFHSMLASVMDQFSPRAALSHFYSQINAHDHKGITLSHFQSHLQDLPKSLRQLLDPTGALTRSSNEARAKAQAAAAATAQSPTPIIAAPHANEGVRAVSHADPHASHSRPISEQNVRQKLETDKFYPDAYHAPFDQIDRNTTKPKYTPPHQH